MAIVGELVERDDSTLSGIVKLKAEIPSVGVENVDGALLIRGITDKIRIRPPTNHDQILQGKSKIQRLNRIIRLKTSITRSIIQQCSELLP